MVYCNQARELDRCLSTLIFLLKVDYVKYPNKKLTNYFVSFLFFLMI